MHLVKRPPGASDDTGWGPEVKKKAKKQKKNTGEDDRDVYERVGKNNRPFTGMCLIRANK